MLGWLPWRPKRRRRKSSGRRRSRRRQSPLRGIPILRWFGPSITTVGVLGGILGVLTGRIELSSLASWVITDGGSEVSTTPANYGPKGKVIDAVELANRPKSDDAIRVATFNIQVFGKSKAAKPKVMQRLAAIVDWFDLVAIQEVRGGDTYALEQLVDLLERSGRQYDFVSSEPIGSSVQTECYAFIYDTQRVRYIEGTAYLVRDEDGLMSREPMVATFEAIPVNRREFAANPRSMPVAGLQSDAQSIPFRFTLINAHTSPSKVKAKTEVNEMDVLGDVLTSVRHYERTQQGEDDCILLGDLNVAPDNLRRVADIPNVVSLGGNMKTNTAGTKTYDHIVIDSLATREYQNRVGVLDMATLFSITNEEAAEISDHQPLWAEFSVYEKIPSTDLATVPGSTRLE